MPTAIRTAFRLISSRASSISRRAIERARGNGCTIATSATEAVAGGDAIEGDLDASHEKDETSAYDATLADAVKRFQERHRIKPDGIVNTETLKAMNVPVESKIRTIELNLERWRWMPDRMPARYIMVDVPDYRFDAIENGKSVLDMRVENALGGVKFIFPNNFNVYLHDTNAGKLFDGLYAIFCGIALLGVTGVLFAPFIHRVVHRFHLEDAER